MKGENAKREIKEGAESVRSVISRSSELDKIVSELKGKIIKVFAVGCGSSLAANHAIASWFIAGGIDAEAVPSSEFYNYPRPISSKTLVILSSQSGKSTETVRAMELAKKMGAITMAITNFSDSPLAMGCRYSFSLNLSKEIALVATKTVDATLAAGYIFSKSLTEKDYSLIQEVPEIIYKILNADILPIVKELKAAHGAYVLGSGLDYAAAFEMSIKLAEATRIQGTVLHTLETSHGPKGGAAGLPAIVIGLQPQTEKDSERVIKELKTMNAKTISISPTGKNLGGDINLEIEIDPELSPFAAIKLAQRIAVESGILKGLDPDSPPGLQKTQII